MYLNFKLLAQWMLNPQEDRRLDAKRHYVTEYLSQGTGVYVLEASVVAVWWWWHGYVGGSFGSFCT